MTHIVDHGKETPTLSLPDLVKDTRTSPGAGLESAKRPRLSHLRSLWSSTASVQESAHHDELTSITLPAVPHFSATDTMTREIRCMAGAACVLCLATTLGSVSLVGAQGVSWPFACTWAGMTLWSVTTTTMTRLALLGQCITVAMISIELFHNPATNATAPPPWFAALPFCALSLFVAVYRVDRANEQLNRLWQRRMHSQQSEAQCVVDTTFHALADQRVAFMDTVSREVQDAALMVITTLEQFSPASILLNTHELLSACSIAVPIASISAINTTIRQVCHVSSHLPLVSRLLRESSSTTVSGHDQHTTKSPVQQEFDIGELAQNVGDALAGMASKLEIHFVIYHSGDGFHYSNVIGDEGAVKHALLNLLRNILEGCTPGACIELGLNVTDTGDQQRAVTFEITHTTAPTIPKGLCAALLPSANFTSQLLKYVDADLSVDDTDKNKTRFKVSISFEPGSDNGERLLIIERPSQILERYLSSVKFSDEPTLSQLNTFITSLKGTKMVLHAQEQSVFAKHLTSCLTGWNADISHVPVISNHMPTNDDLYSNSSADGDDTDATISTSGSTATSAITTPVSAAPRTSSSPKIPSPALEEEQLHAIPPTFVLIDDDFPTLEKKLREFRTLPSAPTHVLQDHHQQLRRHRRSRSSGPSPNFFHQGTTAIIFFATLGNFRRVRDTVHWFALAPQSHPFSMPRVVVVPKPAGPRRFLTALHTAWNNAVVDPQFLPIATSPLNHAQPSSALLGTPIPDAGTPPAPGSAARASPRLEPSNEINNYFFDVPNASPTSSMPTTSPTASDAANRRMRSKSHSSRTPPPRPTDNLLSAINDARRPTPMATLISARPSPASSPAALPNAPTSMTTAMAATTETTETATAVAPPVVSPTPVSPTANAAINPSSLKFETDMTMASEEPQEPPPPAKPKASHRKRKAKKPQSSLSSPPIKVLIVEDNMINQAILSAWMRKHKIKFSVASDGSEAVEKWREGGFHLVLMDIQLPVMNGIEATKTIRTIEKKQKIGVLPSTCPSPSTSTMSLLSTKQNRPLESLEAEAAAAVETMGSQGSAEDAMPSIFRSPVIIVALTASSLESDRQAALAAGCNDFLTKPVSLEWLEKKIMEWGCMQALIDFEGWRMWKRSESTAAKRGKPTTTTIVSSTTATTPIEGSSTMKATNPERGKTEEEGSGWGEKEGERPYEEENATGSSSSSGKSKGILLPGASGLVLPKRRVASTQRSPAEPGRGVSESHSRLASRSRERKEEDKSKTVS